ncbi:MAG: hypothetical protein LBR45_01720 [Bacteroidales bacterium]|jgi:transposase-like protein|nr:hypothetical protein [Bacteroidales bacterium]
MKKQSKHISGQQVPNSNPFPKRDFTDLEKHQIIQEYYNSGKTKQEIWEKYTGCNEEHGRLLRWMRQLGYEISPQKKRLTFVSSNVPYMKNNNAYKNISTDDSFEILQLKKRISELESQLKDSEMKAITFSTMVDIAEREFNISIRKKYNTKSSKK